MRLALFQRGVAEFVGTFALVFVGAGSIIAVHGDDLTAITLAHGLVIGVMASAVGHISGDHFNPAVTFGFFVTRRIEPHLAAVYWFAQLTSAVLAALCGACCPRRCGCGQSRRAAAGAGRQRRRRLRDRDRADLLPRVGDLRDRRRSARCVRGDLRPCLAALAYDRLYLRPVSPEPVGPPETGLEEPAPGDAALG